MARRRDALPSPPRDRDIEGSTSLSASEIMRARSLLFLLAAGLRCTGHIEAAAGPGVEAAAPSEGERPPPAPGSSPGAAPAAVPSAAGPVSSACSPAQATGTRRIWRLSAPQYASALASLFHGRPAPGRRVPALPFPVAEVFSAPAAADRFTTRAESYSMTDVDATAVLENAEEVAVRLVAALRADRAGCLGSSPRPPFGDCVRSLVETRGPLLFRRPLRPEEVARYTALAVDNAGRLGEDAAAALPWQAMLVAPQFLFRTELGDVSVAARLTAFEIAAALALTLTDQPPDQALWDDAVAGRLSTAAQLRPHVERLLSPEAPPDAVLRFLREYFPYPAALEAFKDPKTYPFHDAEGLVADTDQLVLDVLAGNGRRGFVAALLTTTSGFARAATAASYGLPPAGLSTAGRKVTLAQGERAGLLTQPSLLTAFSDGEHNHIVRRGRFIAEGLLCQEVPELPAGLVPPLPDLGADATERDRLAIHSRDPSCWACHRLMDPLGLGFERYDHVGRFRTMEGKRPVDATGVLAGAGAADGPFDGALELSRRLAGAPVVARCFALHTFRYFMGREEQPADLCALSAALSMFERDGDFVGLVTALFTAPSFFARADVSGQEVRR
jgi:hypothetical protein